MKVQLALCAESTSIDKTTGRLSIFNVTDRLSSFTFPLWISRMSLVLNLVKSEDEPLETRGKLRIFQGDTELAARDVWVRYRPETKRCKVVLNFAVAVPAPGELAFRIVSGDIEIEVLRILVVQASSSRPTEPPDDSETSDLSVA